MKRRPLSYQDAVRLLRGDSKLLAAVSRMAGAGLTVASAGGSDLALSLFDLKGEVERLGQDVYGSLRGRVLGLDRFGRTRLLEAAHAVIVVTAFFEALDDLDDELRTTLNTASLELGGAEQTVLATGRFVRRVDLTNLATVLAVPGVIPGLVVGRPIRLRDFYRELSWRVIDFAAGTAAWDRHDETTRDRWKRAVTDDLPAAAIARYEDRLHDLARDCPEVAFWAHRVGVGSVLDRLHATQRDLGRAVGRMTRGRDPDKVRTDLATRYRAQLDRLIGGDLTPEGVRLPTLREVYVNPSYRALPPAHATVRQDEWISERSWQEEDPRPDLQAFVTGHLLTTQAAHAPLVVLGQPGAGKSVSTQVLAAGLDPGDFVVVRVELRAVPSDAGVQQQVEAALKGLTGSPLSWTELAGSRGDAQLVVVLDGFDELLQASGVSHFDYLEQVQAFQEREAELGRPVAVLVTSRTAVADQVRYPEETVVVRLETFDDEQVELWLGEWNRLNPERPLSREAALAQGDLARQPLLLFLLALFHSGGGALTPGIGQAQLFERLFTSFARRDVAKHRPALTEADRRRAVEQELDQLSMVAFAMFNRGRQSVVDQDLVADFAVLPVGVPASREPGSADQRRGAALDVAQRLAGRFFFRLFVQRAQSVYGQATTSKTYEFLHASFGEFLVGRWIVDQLRLMARRAVLTADDLYPPPIDDALLHALVSKAVLSTREQRILGFIDALLARLPADELDAIRTLLLKLFRTCLEPRRADRYEEYRPVTPNAPTGYAVYSANLTLLLLLTVTAQDPEGDLPLTELYPHEKPHASWHALARLWHAQFTENEWLSVLHTIRLTAPDGLDVRLTRWDDSEEIPRALDLLPLLERSSFPISARRIHPTEPIGRALCEATLLGSAAYQEACVALLPFVTAIGRTSYRLQLGYDAAGLIELLINSPETTTLAGNSELMSALAFPGSIQQIRLALGVIRKHVEHIHPGDLHALLGRLGPNCRWHLTACLDLLARVPPSRQLLDDLLTSDPIADEIALFDLLDLRPHGYVIVADDPHVAVGSLKDLLRLPDSVEPLTAARPVIEALVAFGTYVAMLERGLSVPMEQPRLGQDAFALLVKANLDYIAGVRRLFENLGRPDPFAGLV